MIVALNIIKYSDRSLRAIAMEKRRKVLQELKNPEKDTVFDSFHLQQKCLANACSYLTDIKGNKKLWNKILAWLKPAEN